MKRFLKKAGPLAPFRLLIRPAGNAEAAAWHQLVVFRRWNDRAGERR